MGQKIERDHQRFKKLVRGKVKSNLSKYISRGEMIGKKGKDLVSIPLPQIEVPQFRYGNKGAGGVGQGDGQPGQPLGPGGQEPGGGAGDQPGGHILEVELTMEEMADILGEELALPRIKPKGKKNIVTTRDRYTGIRRTGPESLRHFKRTFKRAMKRQISSGTYVPEDPVVVPIRADKQYRSWKEVHQPQSVAVLIYMMDVSGSMTDEQKEIVRIEAFWIDTWIKAHYQGVETVYIIHDAAAQEVDEHTFYHTRESGGTKISSAYTLANKIIDTRFPPDQWNVYAFHFSDGDNWGDDIPHCIELLQEKLLPKLNLFGYGQVESPYGSGEFYEYVHEMLGERDNVVCSRIPDRDAILGSIKEFLGDRALEDMLTPYNTNLPPDLRHMKEEIEGYARGYGLDFFETIFEVIDADDLNEIAAYGGFPTRYPHWSFGMSYEELRKGYDYGLSKIYEMVINNNPCYAYLMRSNHAMDQKLVMAHVYGHCDFFKNNAYFAHTNRKMMDEMANHGTRMRRYVEKYGEDEVEAFMDRCMSIDDLIDVHSTAIKRHGDSSRYDFSPEPEDGDQFRATRFKSKDYMDDYINPRAVLKKEEDERRKLIEQTARNFPEHPEKDVLLFLIQHAPLKPWQRDILEIVRDEAYYFAPQGQTKVLNEGWASYFHSLIMTTKVLLPSEVIDYADHHSGTMATSRGRLNPYKLGIELLRDIEERWNKGRFGKEYDECDDLDKKRSWDTQTGLGRQKIFEVRRVHNDITFIDSFLTPEFCVRHNMFSFAYQEQAGQYIIESRDFEKIKQRLLFGLTNFGKPWIYVVDGNFRNRGELLLRHEFNGVELRLDQAKDTLVNIQFIWGRPVSLNTLIDGKPAMLSYDGSEHSIKTGGETDDPRKHAPAKTK